MMSDNKVMFIAEKETFLARVMIKKVRDENIDCTFVACSIDSINSLWQPGALITFFIEDSLSPSESLLHFLSDKMQEEGNRMILVCSDIDSKFVAGHISKDLIYKTFVRPIDNEAYQKAVVDYFAKENAGEFKKSILIVDDDPNYLSLVREWLKDTYKVSMANSGLQAIKWLGKNKVDLILLDHEMPVTSGPQVLEMLRSDDETKSIPVIFLTGKSDKESVMAVVALRPEGYFLKNIDKFELLEKLKEFFILHN